MITLKTLPQATEQEVFDQVVNHLRDQREKASGEVGCAYRVGELKCAAGCLIADDEYKEFMDRGEYIGTIYHGSSWQGLIDRNIVPNTHAGLISEFQNLHDHCEPEDWEVGFERLAEKHNLKYEEKYNGCNFG